MSRGGENCTCEEGYEPHACPYATEINDNDDPEHCTCCPACEQECSDDI